MTPPKISKISKISTDGVFRKESIDSETPAFERYNLIYGFNGSGKTTISRVLKSLGESQGESIKGQWTFHLVDGTEVTESSNKELLRENVLVFNEDFINENLRWSEGVARPVFYIGAEAAQKSRLLEKVDDHRERRQRYLVDAQQKRDKEKRDFSEMEKNYARVISEALNYGRSYDARHLRQNMRSKDLSDVSILSEEEKDTYREIVRQKSAYREIQYKATDFTDIYNTLSQIKEICATAVSDIVLQSIGEHVSMLGWINEGLKYHQNNNLAECLFCGGEISTDRLTKIEYLINSGVDAMLQKIQRLQDDIKNCEEKIHQANSNLPAPERFTATLSEQAAVMLSQVDSDLKKLLAILKVSESALSYKSANISRCDFLELYERSENLGEFVENLQKRMFEIAELARQHNEEQKSFEKRQAETTSILECSLLKEYEEPYREKKDRCIALENEVKKWEKLVERLERCRTRLLEEIRDHGPAVGSINRMLHLYLGHNEISLETYEQGYRILRRGKPLAGYLSEGERTALALCYFLSKIYERGRVLEEQIVAIDDPVSSLDTGALNFAFTLLRRHLEGAAQLVILTHNLALMNIVKQWLQSSQKKQESQFFILQAKVDADSGYRVSRLRKMPKLLRGHDSEYQYLFYLVSKTAEEGLESEDVPGYIMPNVIRRVLELFLRFKLPNETNFTDAIKQGNLGDLGVEPSSIYAIERLAQKESHSDAFEDFGGLSAVSIEETQEAASAAMKMIETMDGLHYWRMQKLCNKSQFR